MKNFSDDLLGIAEEKWAAYINALNGENLPAPNDSDLAASIKLVFCFSDFVAKRCIQRPGMLMGLIESKDLHRSYAEGEFIRKAKDLCGHAGDLNELSHLIRQFRITEMCRIAFRDLAGWSDLFETMKDLSDLAEASLKVSLPLLYQWLLTEYGVPKGKAGKPQQLVVIGVGKLGGQELNFSSDIDLMFAYPEAGDTDGARSSISNEQFFTRLCQQLIEIIGKNLTDGFVFRVDARLRPLGESGPIVMSFDAMESYYQEQGREWERYALIKARIVAGDESAGGQLLEHLRPFVYRRYLDYGTFESLREMKQKISREISRKGMQGNIKLGSGGIREIEFFGQVFQLIRGGVNPDYQKRSILRILRILARDKGISQQVSQELSEAYVFLRNTENRLQMINDLQTHMLPENLLDQTRLAFSMGFSNWPDFIKTLNEYMDKVHRHFAELLGAEDSVHPEGDEERLINEVWDNLPENQQSLQILKKLGIDEADEVLTILNLFRDMADSDELSSEGCQRIYRLTPKILHSILTVREPAKILKRIYELVKSFRRRSCYTALLLENPDALSLLVNLAQASPWIISFLSQHPLLLDELLDPRALYAPLGKDELKAELSERLNRIKTADLELQMDNLRIFKQINMLRIAAADVAGSLPLMKVSDRLTHLAETVLDQALEMSWEHLVEKHGLPAGIQKGEKGFAVVAYGKLGGFELGYGSDLDLVFLHTGPKGNTAGGRMGPLDHAQFYSRLGHRVIHFLTTMTRTGKLYDIDMRLRPSGNAGILVSHLNSFEEYQLNKAWTWEHQAMIKARPVSGDLRVGEGFLAIRNRILSIARDEAALKEEVRNMREKMRKERRGPESDFFDLKQDPGGVIDIEFIVQFLILLHAHQFPALIQWTDVVRQLNTLALTGIIDDRTAYILKQGYLVFRYCIHRLALEEKPALLLKERFTELREKVKRIWEMQMG